MPDVDFRIDGLTRGRVRFDRRTRRVRERTVAAPLIVALAAAVIVGNDPRLLSPLAVINGVEIRGTRVLVLIDESGSMPRDNVMVNRQLTALAAAGVPTGYRFFVNGSSIDHNSDVAMLPTVLQAIAADRRIDTLYVISDYLDYGYNRQIGISALKDAIRTRGMRVYWATVNNDPQPIYYEIARESGGSVIPPR